MAKQAKKQQEHAPDTLAWLIHQASPAKTISNELVKLEQSYEIKERKLSGILHTIGCSIAALQATQDPALTSEYAASIVVRMLRQGVAGEEEYARVQKARAEGDRAGSRAMNKAGHRDDATRDRILQAARCVHLSLAVAPDAYLAVLKAKRSDKKFAEYADAVMTAAKRQLFGATTDEVLGHCRAYLLAVEIVGKDSAPPDRRPHALP